MYIWKQICIMFEQLWPRRASRCEVSYYMKYLHKKSKDSHLFRVSWNDTHSRQADLSSGYKGRLPFWDTQLCLFTRIYSSAPEKWQGSVYKNKLTRLD